MRTAPVPAAVVPPLAPTVRVRRGAQIAPTEVRGAEERTVDRAQLELILPVVKWEAQAGVIHQEPAAVQLGHAPAPARAALVATDRMAAAAAAAQSQYLAR